MWDWRVARLGGEAYYKNTDKYADLFDECRAHLLIEEAMISVNANAAAFLSNKDVEIPMRAQDVPEEIDWAEWDKLHSNLIPNSSYLTSCTKYLKKLKRKDEGEEESEENISEDEDGHWEQAQSRKRKRKRRRQEISQVTTAIDPLDEICIFKTCWNDMCQCIDDNDLQRFSFMAACDDLHPSLIDSVDRYRGIQKKSSFKSQNARHFSLRLKCYAWSSSPIRRYVDILVQRCIHAVLDGWPLSQATEEAIARVCSFYDSRHSEYQDKLKRAKVAEYLKSQPVILEAAVVQITDAFIKIAIPALGKLITRYARELNYEFLMTTGEKKLITNAIEEEKPKDSKGQIVLNKMELLWRLRYYKYEKGVTRMAEDNKCGKTMVVPVREWRNLVKLISSPPRRTDSDYMQQSHLRDLIHAVERLQRSAKEGQVNRSDELTEQTRNKPTPIKHKREIKLMVFPGASLLVQFSGSCNRSRLPEPAVQLLPIAEDLDICVEHLRDPLNVFAQDAEQVKYLDDDLTSLAAYRRKWEPLVRMDAANSAVDEVSSVTLQGVMIQWNKVKKKKESTEDAFKQDNSKSSSQVVNYFTLKNKFCLDRYLDFHQGDLLCLRLKEVPFIASDSDQTELFMKSQISTHTVVLHAVISRVKTPQNNEREKQKKTLETIKVYFETQGNDLTEKQRKYVESPERKWTVELIPLSFPHRYMQKCLLPSGLGGCSIFIQSICLGTIRPSSISWGEKLEEVIVKKQLKRFKYPLNEEQRKQEQRAIHHNFTIIQGPPGTGKSFLGAQIAAKFAYINKHNANEKKVLYCGPSNKSVDVAAGFLKDLDLKVVRIYSTALEEKLYPNPLKPKSASLSADDGKVPDDNLKSVALHELIRKKENPFSGEILEMDRRVSGKESFERFEMDAYSRLLMNAKHVELKNADIIICTCSYSVLLSTYEEIKVGQCIIDECAMCSEPETILPLVTNNPDQVVLIGDHMQLKPVIKCNKAERLGLGKSLFSRYKEYLGMLTTQYRMHRKIMEFPSKEFYGGKLVCDQSVHDRPKLRDIRISSRSETIFWDVKGEEKVQHFKSAEEGNNSKYNVKEARAVIQLLLRLESYQIPQSRIMVLSPYTAQCARIRGLIQRQHGELKNVHVGTVVTSQGSEADYVILSTVRSLPDTSIMTKPNIQWLRKKLGFLTDANQINVALTRARRRLFIIGNKTLLEVDPLWRKLIQSYGPRAVIDNLQS